MWQDANYNLFYFGKLIEWLSFYTALFVPIDNQRVKQDKKIGWKV